MLEGEEDTEISLHAYQGKLGVRTIRLEGFIKTRSVSVLVDPGSTHNLMQEEVAIRLHMVV